MRVLDTEVQPRVLPPRKVRARLPGQGGAERLQPFALARELMSQPEKVPPD
jgi:hypothetical protein